VLVFIRRVFVKFLDQKLLPESSSRCDQSHNGLRYDFGHTLFCYLSCSTNLGQFVESKLKWDLSRTTMCDQITTLVNVNLVTL
jgi:hypothetical protein